VFYKQQGPASPHPPLGQKGYANNKLSNPFMEENSGYLLPWVVDMAIS
jgi:hypothetical protein